MRDVFVAGAGMTRFAKHHDATLRSLTEEAVGAALSDAGADPDHVEAAYFANAAAGVLCGQEMIRGQTAMRHTGLLGIPIMNVENACASASTAFHLAWMTVASGCAEVALAVGAEKLTHEDKTRTFAAFDGALDLQDTPLPPPDSQPRSIFMDVYAGMARDYQRRHGAGVDDFARVAVKAHEGGARNPQAQYRDLVTVDDVLASRPVSAPLTLLMCSPIGDGAAAMVLASREGLARLEADPVRVLATVVRSGGDRSRRDPTAVERAAQRAYADAGLGPAEVDVVELHDAAAPAELIVTEELGLCDPGGGAELLRSGATALGGRVPVNPSGGLLARGHPVGATGCAQLVEIANQIRGRCGARQVEGARAGLAENGGGWLGADAAVATVTILAR